MSFQKNVFINCPFDEKYRELLKPLIFTVTYLGFDVRISRTESSGNIRVAEIKRHIKESKYAIHDISRNKPMRKNDLPRFNMPFELGIDVGCHEFGKGILSQKKILILDTERYEYVKVLSDIGGQDISNHNDDPITLVRKVRDWFSNNTDKILQGHSEIWNMFNQFTYKLEILLSKTHSKTDIKDLTMTDYTKYVRDWIKNTKK